MDRTAIAAARNCLERAKEGVSSMKRADSLEKMEAAWTDFLVMANRVYVKLEQGAKNGNTSEPWFERKKHARRSDPLLSYIKNARDTDEHGLMQITERTPGQISGRVTEGTIWSGHVKSTPESAEILLHSDDPSASATFQITSPNVKLVDVVNRGVRYGAPTTHLGQPIPDPLPNSYPHPVPVAELAIAHLEALIAEAEGLPP